MPRHWPPFASCRVRWVSAASRRLERLALDTFALLPPALQRLAMRRTHPLYLVGVLGLIRAPGDRLLLFHHTYRPDHPWAPPGGWLERDEPLGEALQREVREESGLTIEPQQVETVLVDSRRQMVEILLHARLVGGEFTPSEEVDRMQLAGPGELPEGLQPRHRPILERVLASWR